MKFNIFEFLPQLNIYLTLQNQAAGTRDHALAVRINPMNRLYFPAESWCAMCFRMLSVDSFVNWTLQFAALQRNTQIRIQIYKILDVIAENNFKGLEAGEFSSVSCLCYDNILTPHSIRTIMRLTSASQHDKITF